MNIKLLIGGKEIDAQISEADAQKIQPSESRFVRKANGENYICVDSCGIDLSVREDHATIDDFRFSTGNYFTSEKQAQDHIRALKLWQAIKVFRQEREGNKWKSGAWYVTFSKSSGTIMLGRADRSIDQTTRFFDLKTAQSVKDEFYGELMWYFTEFEDD